MTTQSKSAGLDPVVFIDTETMGVDARVHDVWNIGPPRPIPSTRF